MRAYIHMTAGVLLAALACGSGCSQSKASPDDMRATAEPASAGRSRTAVASKELWSWQAGSGERVVLSCTTKRRSGGGRETMVRHELWVDAAQPWKRTMRRRIAVRVVDESETVEPFPFMDLKTASTQAGRGVSLLLVYDFLLDRNIALIDFGQARIYGPEVLADRKEWKWSWMIPPRDGTEGKMQVPPTP